MSYTRAKSKRQLRHTGSRTHSHRIDKLEGEARTQKRWFAVPVGPSPLQKRDLSALGAWEIRLDENQRWVRCSDPEENGDYVEAEAKRRSWYVDTVTRNGKSCKMRRKAATPIEILTVSFAPYLSAWIDDQLSSGRCPRSQVAAVTQRFFRSLASKLSGHRILLGLSLHCDTSDAHLDICVSRQTGDGGRIGGPGLALAGPWLVGTDRQLRSGAIINAVKQRRFEKNHAKHRERYGADAVPFDVMLARELDSHASEVIPELAEYRRRYAQEVPALERAHLDRALQQARAAADELQRVRDSMESLSRPPSDISR